MSAIRSFIASAAAGVLFGLLSAGVAFAQHHDWSPPPDNAWKWSGYMGVEAQGETDLDRSAQGDFDYWMPQFGLAVDKRINDVLAITLQGDYRAIVYDFDLPAGGGEPWETINVARFNPLLTLRVAERWSLIGGPIFEIAGETGADFGDSLRGGGNLAVAYRANTFSVAVGILVTSEIEDDAYIQPILLVNWGVGGGLRVNANATSSRGGDLRVGYTFLQKWTAALAYGFRRERFRLDDDGVNEDGVGQEEAQIFKGILSYTFEDGMAVEGYVGTTIDGDFRLENRNGSRIATSDYDDAVFGGVMFKFAF